VPPAVKRSGGFIMKISKRLLDELVDAYEDNDPMHQYFLNVKTGEVEFLTDYEPDEELSDRIEEGFGEIYFRVPRISSSEGYDVMEEFAETVASSKIRQRLCEALNRSKKVFRRFKDVLDDYPEERDRYYKFLRKYCEEQIIQWLKEEEIEITLKSIDTGQPK
jgi:hypothetical protein